MTPRASRLRAFAAKLRGFLPGRRADDQFDAEIDEHLRLLAERYAAQGMSRDDAARAARRQFGNTTLLEEDRRALQTLPTIEAMWQDVRYACRLLWKDRAFAAVSIVTLGLGIGAATAIFSVVNNVVLAPFPYTGAERMVFPRIHNTQQSQGGRQGYTATEARAIFDGHHVFDGIVAAAGDRVWHRHRDGTDLMFGARVTPGTFEFFGMPALHGRVLQPSDYEPGAPPVFVMRHKIWMERFNGDPAILNQSFVLSGTPRTLVGIMPPRFGWYGADVFIPDRLTPQAYAGTADSPTWFLIGRLKPGLSPQQAEADLTPIMTRLAKLAPQDFPPRFVVHARKLGDRVVGGFEATLYTVLAAVGVLVLIACSNVANLMLIRATKREQEFAVRVVLGAGRGRLIRLVMVESLLLAMGGAAFGVFLAWAGLTSLVAAMPQGTIPAEAVIELNAPVLTATLVLAVLTTLIFGLVPALQSSRRDLNHPLRDTGRSVSGGVRSRRLRDALVVMEVALSLALLTGAGLLMRSFAALRDVNLGFRADHVVAAVLPLPAERYKTGEDAGRLFQPLITRLKGAPGVVDAAVAHAVPPYGGGDSRMRIAGRAYEDGWHTLVQHISDAYFRVLRVELKAGRPISDVEVDRARRVAVVNETFVRTYLPNDDPIGRRVHLARFDTLAAPGDDAGFEIVGVVGDMINRGLRVPIEPEVWVPYTIASMGTPALIVRTSQDPGTVANTVRKEIWAIDAGVATASTMTLTDRINNQLYAGPRFAFLVMSLFGGIGLLLVTVGVYSVLAYSATQRTHEIGIRMALGAEATDALRLVVRTGLRLVAAGIAIGIGLSLILGRVIGTQLVGVTIYDPPTLAATTVLLMLTAALACWIPARRAARVDPMIALRYE